MNFFKDVGNSIYSPKFYTSLLTKSFKKSVGYFLLLILSLTILNVIALISPLLLDTPKVLNSFAENIINCYPKDLEIKIQNGQVSTNLQEPYFITSCEGEEQNLAVIDTQTPYSVEKFNEYNVAAWVGKDSVTYKKNDFETRTYSLAQIKDFKLDKQVLDSFYQSLSPYLKFIGPSLLLIVSLGLYAAYLFRLLHLLLISSLIWLLGKMLKYSLRYGQAYKIGLHAITLGLIVELLISLTSRWTNFYSFPFMLSVLTLVVVLVNLILPKKGQDS